MMCQKECAAEKFDCCSSRSFNSEVWIKRKLEKCCWKAEEGEGWLDFIKAGREGWKWLWPLSIPPFIFLADSSKSFLHKLLTSFTLWVGVCILREPPRLHNRLTSTPFAVIALFPVSLCVWGLLPWSQIVHSFF